MTTATRVHAHLTLTDCQAATVRCFARLDPRPLMLALEQYRESQGDDAADRVERAVKARAV